MAANADITLASIVRSEPPSLPIGVLSLCSNLESNGFRVAFEDYRAWNGRGIGKPASFASWLARSAPVLGISVFTSSLPLVLAAAPRLKALRPELTLILGGPGTTGVERKLLERFPSLDIGGHGEGEETIVEIMESRRDRGSLSRVRGISYRDGAAVITTPPRPRNAELERLPFPAYHLADLEPYLDDRWTEFTPFGVFLGRGCIFQCTFCAIPATWQGKVCARSPASAVAELRILKERHGVKAFRLLDDTFTVDRRRALAFCDAYSASGLDLPWLCHARVDCVDESLIESLAAAGCRLVFYGMESGSDRVLQRLRKGFTVKRALDAVEMSARHVIVETSFMWGFPFETLDDFHDTLIAILAVHDMGGRTKLSWFDPVSQAALTRECAPLLSTRLRQAAFPTRAHMDVYKYGPELLRIVRANRDIFSSFFYLEYPGQSAKARYLKKALKSGDAPQRTAAVSRHRADHDGMPLAKRSCSLRTVGGRQFVFDREGARAFRVNAVGARVFEACRTHEPHAALVEELMSRYGETERAIGNAIDRVLAQLGDEGLLATRVRPTTASRQCALPCRK